MEYSEITKEMAYEKDEQGYLVYDTSHMLNAVYNLDFLEYLVKEGTEKLVNE